MHPYKIAIIDDHPAVLQSLRLVLEGVFTSVVTAHSPLLLPSILSDGEVDAVVLDMNFDSRKLDGEEGLRWLRYIRALPTPPAVVLITAFGDISLAVRSLKEGAEDFITKPWDNDELVDKLLRAIDKRTQRMRQEQRMKEAARLEHRREATRQMTLDEIERRHITEILDECGGNLSEAAVRLGISRQTLYNRLKKYGLIQ